MGLFKEKDGKKKVEQVYDLKEKLGEGNFAIVKRATRKKDMKWADGVPEGVTDDTEFAIKIIDKSKVEDMGDIEREVDILKMVSHKSILKLFEVYETPKKMNLVTEIANGGELFDRIVERGNYTEKDAASVIWQLCDALRYLHEKKIVHRDLKPENILLATKAEDSPIKLADFGLARIYSAASAMKTACGTPGSVAPEVLQNKGYSSGAVDMWSVGVILYILLCGFPPFYEEELPALFEQILKARYDFPSPWWDTISQEAKNTVKGLLKVEPAQRLKSENFEAVPWLLNAPESQLTGAQAQLKKYAASMKLKKAARKVMMMQKLAKAASG